MPSWHRNNTSWMGKCQHNSRNSLESNGRALDSGAGGLYSWRQPASQHGAARTRRDRGPANKPRTNSGTRRGAESSTYRIRGRPAPKQFTGRAPPSLALAEHHAHRRPQHHAQHSAGTPHSPPHSRTGERIDDVSRASRKVEGGPRRRFRDPANFGQLGPAAQSPEVINPHLPARGFSPGPVPLRAVFSGAPSLGLHSCATLTQALRHSGAVRLTRALCSILRR